MTEENAFFRHVMGQFATGVTVVTTATSEGICGMTVNAFTSVSLAPPLIAICVERRSQTLSYIRASGCFAVNVLEASQEALSRCFASASAERSESFCHVPYRIAVTGSPVLAGVMAFLDARIVAEYPGGDHLIIVGQVEALGQGGKVQHVSPDGTAHGAVTVSREGNLDQVHQFDLSTRTPLLYYQGQYRHLSMDGELTSLKTSSAQDAKKEPTSPSRKRA